MLTESKLIELVQEMDVYDNHDYTVMRILDKNSNMLGEVISESDYCEVVDYIKNMISKYGYTGSITTIDVNKMFKLIEMPMLGAGRQESRYFECQCCYCIFPEFQIQIHRNNHRNFNVTGDLK